MHLVTSLLLSLSLRSVTLHFYIYYLFSFLADKLILGEIFSELNEVVEPACQLGVETT